MNDINQIRAANTKVILDNLPALLANGQYVVIEKAGLHVLSIEQFSGEGAEGRAQAKLDELNARGDSTTAELHKPTGAAPAIIGGDPDDEHPVTASTHGFINDAHLEQRFGANA